MRKIFLLVVVYHYFHIDSIWQYLIEDLVCVASRPLPPPHLSIFILVGYQSNACPMTLITKCSLSTFCKKKCKTSVISSLNGRRRRSEAWRYLCRKPELSIACPQLLCSCFNFFPRFHLCRACAVCGFGERVHFLRVSSSTCTALPVLAPVISELGPSVCHPLNIGNLCLLSSWSDLLEIIQSYRSFPRTSMWLSRCSFFLPSVSPVSALFLSSSHSFSLHLLESGGGCLDCRLQAFSIFPSWAFTAPESLWALRWHIDLISRPVLCSSHPIPCILSISWDVQRKILVFWMMALQH